MSENVFGDKGDNELDDENVKIKDNGENKLKKVPVVTVPMAPFIPKGKKEPLNSVRMRPCKALDLRKMFDVMKEEMIQTTMINEKPWSVIPTISPYSDDFHVMLMETSKDRYLPSMEYIKDDEGNFLMNVWIAIVNFMKKRREGQQIFVGYNWSPRSWGKNEEKTGFQSIPTKWHGMFWSWPKSFEDEKIEEEKNPDSFRNYKRYDWIDGRETSESFKRLNGETSFGKNIARDFKKYIDDTMNKHPDSKIKEGKSIIENGACIVQFNHKMEDLFAIENFFSLFLKPLAKHLDKYFIDLTDLFFKKPWCKDINDILDKTSKGKISCEEYKSLQDLPKLKEDDEILYLLGEKGFSNDSKEELLNLVKNRYILEVLPHEKEKFDLLLKEKRFSKDLVDLKELIDLLETKHSNYFSKSWRKGFAYTLTFKEKDSMTEMKITPGAYLGSAGVVETENIVLKRPEDYALPIEDLRRKSKELYDLAEEIDSYISKLRKIEKDT